MADKSLEENDEKLRERMINVTDIHFENFDHSIYIQPLRLIYKQDERVKIWDLMNTHDCAVVIIFNTDRKKLMFVRQFRPASYCANLPRNEIQVIDFKNYLPTLGLTVELCGGVVEKNKSSVEAVHDRVREECGYEVPLSAFNKIITYKYIGSSSCNETLYYVEVTDEMKIQSEEEKSNTDIIEVVEMSVDEVKKYISSEEVESPPSFLSGVAWFLINKENIF